MPNHKLTIANLRKAARLLKADSGPAKPLVCMVGGELASQIERHFKGKLPPWIKRVKV